MVLTQGGRQLCNKEGNICAYLLTLGRKDIGKQGSW